MDGLEIQSLGLLLTLKLELYSLSYFMKSMIFFIAFFIVHLCLFGQSYERVHAKAIVIDTHNDALSSSSMKGMDFGTDLTGKTHTDLDRLIKAGVDVQVFSIFCNEKYGKGTAFSYANREIDSLYAIAARLKNKIEIVRTPAALKKAVRRKKLAAMMGVEGGHMMEDDMNKLDSFYKRGVRYMTLTWNNSTSWASSARDETLHPDSQHNGLNEFGRQIVAHMNEMGMLVDLSHVGEQTFKDVISITTKPVLLSHSSVYAICPHFRNLKDDQILAVGKNGGVIDINFYSGFLDSNYAKGLVVMKSKHQLEVDSLILLKWSENNIVEWLTQKYTEEANLLRPSIKQMVDHIDYIVKLIGIDHVGIGSDFDGIESPPRELDDVTGFPLVTKELLNRGYRRKDIKKILGGNFIRVLRGKWM